MNILLSFLSAILPLIAHGSLSFRNLSVEQGLSNSTVSTICQDNDNIMWMATKSGVNSFDGYDTKIYRFDPNDINSLQSNLVNTIFVDQSGEIWACTADGLSRFDKELELFRRVDIGPVHSIEEITMAAPSLYLLGTRNTTVKYDSSTGHYSEFLLDGKPVRFYSSVRLDDCLVLGTSYSKLEFLRFHDGGDAERVSQPVKLPRSAKCLLKDKDTGLWIGTNKGLLHVDLESGTVNQVQLSNLPADQITDIETDLQGRIWIGTKYGICIYDPATGTDRMVGNNPFDVSEPSDKGVRDIFRDKQGNMWVGYSNHGVDFVNVRPRTFHLMRHSNGIRSISGDNVRSLMIERDGTLWIGTRYNGLDSYNTATGEFRAYGGNIQHILCLLCPTGNDDVIYVSAFNDGSSLSRFGKGIIEVNKHTGAMRRILKQGDINNMVETRDGLIWLACLSGLYLFNPRDGSSRKIPLTDDALITRVLTVMVDRAGHLWVGAKESLNEYEVNADGSLKKITDPALKDVVRAQVLHEGQDGTIWIGTSDGLLRYHDGELESVGNDGTLRGRYINGIMSGTGPMLWVCTDCGLYRYDTVSKKGKLCYSSDGIQYNQFNLNASCKSSDGVIYMGSTYGIVYFDPSEMKENTETVTPRISGIMVHNKDVKPSDGSGILSRSIDQTRSITLRHDQDALTLRFSCSDYASEGLNTFEYRLDPFSHDWVQPNSREATYTNLKKGEYVFRVRCANSDGVWNADEATLGITVKPVWYETNLAKITFCLILCSILAAVVIRILKNAKIKNEHALETMRLQYESEMLKTRISSYLAEGHMLNAAEEEFLLKLISKIENRCSDQCLSVEAIASDMCMSRSNLHLKVRSITGSSTIELIKKIRIEKACSLIRNTDLPLVEIAERAGFNSPSYFSNCFHIAMGVSPATYLSEMRKRSGSRRKTAITDNQDCLTGNPTG